jgi:tubulin polyglutamylase TTLL4
VSNVVRNAFRLSGYHLTKSGARFHGLWGKHLKREDYAHLSAYQRVNHFPGTFELGRKDRLHRNLCRMRRHASKEAWVKRKKKKKKKENHHNVRSFD